MAVKDFTPINFGTGVPTLDSAWKATKFDGWGKTSESKYNVLQMTYPADLHQPEYGGNMVVFYINIANASKFQTDNGNNNGGSYDIKDSDIKQIRTSFDGTPISSIATAAVGANVAKDALIGGGAGAANGISTGWAEYAKGGLSNLLKNTGAGILKGFGAGIVGGIAANATDAVGFSAAQSIAGTTTREQKRLRSAIALHIPNNLSVRYSSEWGSTDTGNLYMTAEAPEAAMSAIKSLFNDDNRVGPASSIAANIALSGNSKNAGAVSAATGLAANPRKELVFKGVDFRTFTFDYSFFPRSETEAKNVENIINAFKFHMQPEFVDTNSFLYLYPSEFDISYYTNGVENLHIHRHTSCVLQDMSINYTPNGSFTTFDNGMPTQINISLTFKELTTMSKELVNKGL